jgi:hypothetical protein
MSYDDERCVVPKATISNIPKNFFENQQNLNNFLLKESKEDVERIEKIYKEAHTDLDKVWMELKKRDEDKDQTLRRALDFVWRERSRSQFTSYGNKQKDGC